VLGVLVAIFVPALLGFWLGLNLPSWARIALVLVTPLFLYVVWEVALDSAWWHPEWDDEQRGLTAGFAWLGTSLTAEIGLISGWVQERWSRRRGPG
jgi:hypothetical protein